MSELPAICLQQLARRVGTWTRPQLLQRIEAYWDADAEVYDTGAHSGAGRACGHAPVSAAERAAWAAVLARHLPAPPSKVLDVGSGTGLVALTAARLGHEVTALDISARMLAKLQASATADGLEVRTVKGTSVSTRRRCATG